jgi:hypothetical protein
MGAHAGGSRAIDVTRSTTRALRRECSREEYDRTSHDTEASHPGECVRSALLRCRGSRPCRRVRSSRRPGAIPPCGLRRTRCSGWRLHGLRRRLALHCARAEVLRRPQSMVRRVSHGRDFRRFRGSGRRRHAPSRRARGPSNARGWSRWLHMRIFRPRHPSRWRIPIVNGAARTIW